MLPLWEHGLKHSDQNKTNDLYIVAPFMGAWIETYLSVYNSNAESVAPFMGAWIETVPQGQIISSQKLLPLWEHVLKQLRQ